VRRIVCLGNALRDDDRAGPEVHARLARTELPGDVEAVDGGLLGLDLLGAMEGARSVVFVDSVRGFGAPGEVVVLSPEEIAAGGAFDHAAGLPYLLGVYRALLPPPLPRVAVVGVEEPAGAAALDEAARVALALCTEVADVTPA
jgi:hydrogenase maturation protease